jgi:hypothetical protein
MGDLSEIVSVLDLAAQQDMAFWTRLTFFASAASVLLSLGALIGLFLSLRQTRRAIADTREIGEYQIQAYVHASKLEYAGAGRLNLYCKNTGATPAAYFSVASDTRVVKISDIKASDPTEASGFKTWPALGGGDERSVGLTVDVKSVLDFQNGLRKEDEALLVVGRILYRTIFNHDHETHFTFYVDRASPKTFRQPTSANVTAFRRIADGGPRPDAEKGG